MDIFYFGNIQEGCSKGIGNLIFYILWGMFGLLSEYDLLVFIDIRNCIDCNGIMWKLIEVKIKRSGSQVLFYKKEEQQIGYKFIFQEELDNL